MSDTDLKDWIADSDKLPDGSSGLSCENQVAAFPSSFSGSSMEYLLSRLSYDPRDQEDNLLDNALYLLDEFYDLDSGDLIRPGNNNLFVSEPHLENEIIAIAARVSKDLGLYSSGNYGAYAQIVAESLYDLVEATKRMESEAKLLF